jgi:flagellar motor protein MotB
MGWAKNGLGLGLLLSLMAAGCQSKMYDQNKALYDENRALRDQNEQLKRQQSMLPPQAPAQPLPPLPPPPPVVDSQPAPEAHPQPIHPKSVEQIGGLETSVNPNNGNTTVVLPSKAFFDPGQATLQSSAKSSLDAVVTALKKKFAGKKIVVEGHTDSTPIRVSKWKSNQELSEARAAAVKTYLVSKGIDASRISIKGYGDTKPRSTTDISKNRRVEIVVVEHVTSE